MSELDCAVAQAEFWGAELVSAAVQLHAAKCAGGGSLKDCGSLDCKRYLRALEVTPEEALERKRRAERSPTDRKATG